jgi:hypothetical protein
MVEEDDLDQEPVRTSAIEPIPIRNLFDFTKNHWVELYSRTALRSFDEELAAYEMLDLDAQGDEEIDIDESTGELLLMYRVRHG